MGYSFVKLVISKVQLSDADGYAGRLIGLLAHGISMFGVVGDE